jgi:hypothetical protein
MNRLAVKLANWARGLASDAVMVSEFAFGGGPQVRVFGANSIESADIRSDPMVWVKQQKHTGLASQYCVNLEFKV